MTIYQSSSSANSEGGGKVFLFPLKEKFLAISLNSKGIDKAELLTQQELSSQKEEAHYFDLGTSYNLLPTFSDEMLNDEALITFMNWTPQQKVYKRFDEAHGIQIQFQTQTVADFAVSHAIPSVSKHHVLELLLSICKTNGVHLLIFANRVFIAVHMDREIKLCNTFDIKTDEEVLYYLLLIYQELGLSQEEVPLNCYGKFPEKHAETEKHLSVYIRNVKLSCLKDIEPPYQGIAQLTTDHYANN